MEKNDENYWWKWVGKKIKESETVNEKIKFYCDSKTYDTDVTMTVEEDAEKTDYITDRVFSSTQNASILDFEIVQ